MVMTMAMTMALQTVDALPKCDSAVSWPDALVLTALFGAMAYMFGKAVG